MQSEDLARAASVLGGDAAWPALDGDPVFDEPWQGRAFAVAFELVDRSGWRWDDFRERLVAAIADDPTRPYYESWLDALERLSGDTGAVDDEAVERARNHAASYRYHDERLGDVETFPFAPDGAEARVVLRELFDAIPADVLGRCRHAELYRVWVGGAPTSWGARVFVGDELEQVAVALPDPSGSDRWGELRRRLLGLGPDSVDRAGHT